MSPDGNNDILLAQVHLSNREIQIEHRRNGMDDTNKVREWHDD
jgi:hypothetical protein